MLRPTRRRLVPLLLGALTLLAGGLVAPQSAQAACNHYVIAQSDRIELTTPTDLDMLVPSSVPVTPADHPLPCAGLSCSSAPVVPPPPAPAPVRVVEWGCVFESSAASGPDSVAALTDSETVRPIHYGLSIDRPPRPSTASRG
jgi:hypothetical protein